MLRERLVYRCAPGFYLAKPHDAGNVRLSSCSSVLSNAHDLGDNKGRFECILTGGALHYYTLHSTCIVCPAGRVKAAAGTFLLSPHYIVRNERSLASHMCSTFLRLTVQ